MSSPDAIEVLQRLPPVEHPHHSRPRWVVGAAVAGALVALCAVAGTLYVRRQAALNVASSRVASATPRPQAR